MNPNDEIEKFVEEGRKYALAKQFEGADKSFLTALTHAPDNVAALCGRASSLRSMNQYEAAQAVLNQGLALHSDNIDLQMEQGKLYYSQGAYDKAVASLEKVLKLDKDNVEALGLKISSLRSQGMSGDASKLEEAGELADQSLIRFPNNRAIVILRGWVYYDQQQYETAFEIFMRSAYEEGLKSVIAALRSKERLGEAETALSEALKHYPQSSSILREQAALQLARKEYEQAFESYKSLGDESGVQSVLYALRVERQFDLAEKRATEAVNRFPKSVLILNELAAGLLEQNRYAEAVSTFDKVLDTDEDNSFALGLRLRALSLQGRAGGQSEKRAAALKMADEYVKRFPDKDSILIECGWAYYRANDFEKARKAFLKANTEDGLVLAVAILRVRSLYWEAEESVTNGLRRFPKSAALFNEHAMIYYSQGIYDKAIELFERALAIEPKNIFALARKISALRMQGRDKGTGKLEQAEALVRQSLVAFPDNAEFLFEHGWIYWDQDQFEKADEAFSRAIEKDPSTVIYATAGRVNSLVKMNRANQAGEILKKLRESLPDDPDVAVQYGWFLLQRYDYLNAKKEFEAILGESNSVLRNNGLGGVYFMQGDYEEAEVCFRKVLAVTPNDPTLHNNLAWALVRQETTDLDEAEADLDEAEAECRTALKINPNYSSAHGCLGIIAFKRGRLRESEDHLQESIRVNDKEGNYTDLGALYVQMGRYKEAAEQLKKALARSRDDAQAHIELGNLYLLTDRIKRAVPELRQAVAIDPDNAEAHRALGIALMRAGDMGEAERVLRNAIKRLDKNKRWRLHLMLCQLLTKRGDSTDDRQLYEEALAEVNKAVDLEPEQPDPYFYKGLVRFKLEDYYRAWKSFRDCLSKNKDHYEAERNARLVRALIVKEKGLQLGSIIGGFLLGVVSVGQLVVMWVLYLNSNKVSERMLTIMIPILLGLFVVAFLLPGLVRLKLPGLEAELSQPKQKESISSGPKGEVGSGSAPAISSGPR